MQSLSDIWTLALKELTERYGQTVSDLWFPGLSLYELTDSRAILICDMPFKYKIIKTKYIPSIEEALELVMGFSVEVILVDKVSDPDEFNKYVFSPQEEDVPEPTNLADRVVTPARLAADPYGFGATGEIPDDLPFEERERMMREKVSTAIGGYNAYTFENFIVGQSNKLAYAASVAVANEPDCISSEDSYTYNPLFIHGPSGLGKTHLLYSIINQVKFNWPSLKIVYVKGEEFTNQLIDSISKKTPEKFREKYRTADILLIDDIQFIAGREATQEEFFHTFNALYEDHKQIILTSDRPPKDIQLLEERLKTRFEWGIIADIQPPDADLRAAILKKKAEAINITIDNEVLNFLAENLKSNVRQIEGAIKKLGALSVLTGEPITIELAKNSIADLMNDGKSNQITAEKILECVSKKYGVTIEDIKGRKQTSEITYIRHIAMYLMRKVIDLSLPKIGKLLDRNHATVISSLKKVEKDIGTGNQTDTDIRELIKELEG